jgi:DNA-directed RNA polymerase II subunit RPB1
MSRGHSNTAHWVVNYWLFHNGFSIGIGDTATDWKTMEYIAE